MLFQFPAHTDLIIIGYSSQYSTNDEPLCKIVNQFGLFPKSKTFEFFL